MLASLEVASGRRARARGLIGRDTFDGALLLRPTRQIHTFGMRFPIDVAYCDPDLRVVTVVAGMKPQRLGLPRLRCPVVIEAEAGSLERWRVRAGDELEVG